MGTYVADHLETRFSPQVLPHQIWLFLGRNVDAYTVYIGVPKYGSAGPRLLVWGG